MDQKEMIDRYDTAIKHLDNMFPVIPIFSPFTIPEIIHLNFSGTDKEELDKYSEEITELLVDKFKYADDYGRTEKAPSRLWITLNLKGIAAKNAGGHLKYDALLMKKEKAERISNWPKRNWWLVAIIMLVIGVCADIGKELLNRIIWPSTSQSALTTPTSTDSVLNHKTVQKIP